eukprot:702228-Lingulodinium_polyedra.AAC.1
MRGMHSQLTHLGDTATYMKVSRFCLDASKLQHLLRFYGEALQPVLEEGDEATDLTFNRLVKGLTPEGRTQAASGEQLG